MYINRILAQKGDRIISVGRETPIAEVAALLTNEKIGAVLVLDDQGSLVGVLSERDIVTAIARRGRSSLEQKAEELMTSEVVTCKPADTVTLAMSLMTERNIRHLPVLDDEKLVGLISIRDVVRHRLREVEGEAAALREYITTA